MWKKEKSKIYDAFVLLHLSCYSNVYAALVYPTSDVEKREKKKFMTHLYRCISAVLIMFKQLQFTRQAM